MAAKSGTAEGAVSSEASASKPAPRKRLKFMIIAGAAVLVLGGAGTTAMFAFGKKPQPAPGPIALKPLTFYDLPEVLVNLAQSGERTQYLKVKVVLELSDAALVQQIQPVLPRVMDTFQVYLRELRPSDLEGSAGLYRLKEELTRRVNAAISPNRVNAVLFKEMVIQ